MAFGNCVPDLILNLSLVNKGFAEMALSGSTAGPLFNLLFGFGLSLIRHTISGNVELDFFNWNGAVFHLALACLGMHFVRLILQATWLKYNLTANVGKLGLLIYLSYFVLVTIGEFIN